MKKNRNNCDTLTGLLEYQVHRRPNKVAVTIDRKDYSWSWLHDMARLFASQLASDGVRPGTSVIIRVPNSIEFFIAFYGTLYSAGIPVPVFPQTGWERCKKIMKLCGSRDIILPYEQIAEIKYIINPSTTHSPARLHGVKVPRNKLEKPVFVYPKTNDTALIQYTSGSTCFPKGVMLSHQQILTNLKQMTGALKVTAKDIFVSWLPAQHDMGLILCILVPLYTGAKLILLSKGIWQIHTWMEAISAYGGTITAAPDLAYRLCVKGIRQPWQYDLSTLRVALNAAEPIRERTIRMFEDHFGIKNVMTTGYGLAEAAVAVTIHSPGKPIIIDRENHVSSGRALKDIRIRIISGKRIMPDGVPGEIQVQSPACMLGYFKSPKKIFTSDGYLPTGDFGYLDHYGNLFVLGRKKNVIKQGGQTIYADDLEEVVGTVEGVRRVAALGIQNKLTGSENLVVMAEYNQINISQKKGYRLITEIVERIYNHFGQRPARVFLLRPKSIPLTPNGKKRYIYFKDVYLNQQRRFKKMIIYS